jgi:hypothetical protein
MTKEKMPPRPFTLPKLTSFVPLQVPSSSVTSINLKKNDKSDYAKRRKRLHVSGRLPRKRRPRGRLRRMPRKSWRRRVMAILR